MGNAVAGMCLMTSAKMLMTDIFSAALPLVVTTAFATKYVATLSAGNAAGRLGWSALSDVAGRKNTYFLFGMGIPISASIPFATAQVAADPSLATPLYAFYGGTVVMISCYGGLFSTLPAYIADVFGQNSMGAIHGRVLTAWSAAAVLGPNTLAYFKKGANMDACTNLSSMVEPKEFEDKFGASMADIDKLVDSNTVTISRLMEIVPAGTTDPTPMLYDSTMYGIAGMLSVAFLANAAMKPVDAKFHLTPSSPSSSTSAARKD